MAADDVRWIQRLEHYKKALVQMEQGVELAEERQLSDLEKQGLIQSFEFTHELACNTLKDFFESRGVLNLYGSKDTTRKTFKEGLIDEGEVWMEMIQSRNLTSHTYNEETANQILKNICDSYFREFKKLEKELQKLKEKQQS
jgi:nucleotidyltransferase substrate binding protein (TIGR01987 family)